MTAVLERTQTTTTHDARVPERFALQRVLGKGGFAVTYAAHDKQTGRDVALKILNLSMVDEWKAVELFEREAFVLRGLEHRRIPAYVDFIAPRDGNNAFLLAQELAPGLSLRERVAQGWRPSGEQLEDIARQVLEILVYLQSLHPPVFHRDVKPDNIMLADDGSVRLVDFGSVKAELARESQMGSVVGTFGFMAPEQFQGRAYASTDLYGLGATLLNIMTGRAPADLPHVGLGLDVRAIIPGQPYIETWLVRMLAPDPDQRFDSAASALASLHAGRIERVAPQLRSVPAERPAAPPRDAGRVREEPFPVAAIIWSTLLAAAFIVGGYFAVTAL